MSGKRRWFMPVVHPAATFRRPGDLGPLSAHIDGFVRRIAYGFPKEPQIEIDPGVDLLRRLGERVVRIRCGISVDVESSAPPTGRAEWGLLPGFAALKAIGIGAVDGGGVGFSWAWPIRPAGVLPLLHSLFADRRIPKIFQNGWAFDIPILERHGFKFAGPIHDTRDARRALSSTSKLSLEAQASFYLDIPPWKTMVEWDDGEDKDESY